MKILSKYCLLACLPLVVAGCGGSSSTPPNTSSQTMIQVSNTSPSSYSQATIFNASGAVVYDSSFSCSPSATDCFINANVDINQGYALLLKDTNQRLIRAAVIASPVGEYIALAPSPFSTGFYLMDKLSEELLKESSIDWDSLNQRVQTFFTNYNSADGTVDPFEEVGNYYASQLAKGIRTEREFLDAFKLRLINWDVAATNELPNASSTLASLTKTFNHYFKANSLSLISSAHAQSNSCAPALKTFLSIAGNIGKVIPVVGEGVAGTAKLASSYCDSSGDQLKQISAQLNDLQNSVNKIAGTLGALSKFLFDQVANNKTTEFELLAKNAEALAKQYERFLIQNGNVKSLQEFFTKAGGWERGIQKGGKALDTILNAPYYFEPAKKGLYPSIIEISTLTEYNNYIQALKNRCDQLNTSTKDNFIITRQQCNNIILANTGRLVAAQGLSLPIFKDIYATLGIYQQQAQNTYLLPSGLNSYASAYSDANASFANQQANMIETYQRLINPTGFFDAYLGLNTSLMAALTSRECNQSGVDRTNFPAIIGWYAPTTNDKQNYIETNCKLGNQSTRIKARYYMGDQGNVNANDVVNILGVPVAAAYADRTNDLPVPLYFSTQSFANRTKFENFATSSSDSGGSLYLEAPTARAVGAIVYPSGVTGGVISPNLIKNSNDLYYLGPSGAGTDYLSLYVLVPFKSDYFRVARLNFSLAPLILHGSVDCIAAPCRVDPSTKQWIIFTEDGETLDLRPTTRSFNGRKIGRVAPVGF
jgi:hypothetical protein